MKAKKKALKQRLVNFKVTPTQYTKIKKKAEKHSGGNISNWIRMTATESPWPPAAA